jgi:hypothetical protein
MSRRGGNVTHVDFEDDGYDGAMMLLLVAFSFFGCDRVQVSATSDGALVAVVVAVAVVVIHSGENVGHIPSSSRNQFRRRRRSGAVLMFDLLKKRLRGLF